MAEQIQVISRAMSLLEILSRTDGPMSLMEISQASGLPKSTLHRLLSALEFDNYVKNEGGGKYRIARSMLCLSAKILRCCFLTQASSILRDLREKTNCTAYLSMINNDEMVYLHRAPGPVTPLSNAGWVGELYYSAGGRVILSTYSDEKIRDYLERIPLQPRTKKSITSKEEFMAEMEATRQRGYSKSFEEYTLNVLSVGAPIFDHTEACYAAVSLSGVRGTTTDDIESFIPLLLAAAHTLSIQMGASLSRF